MLENHEGRGSAAAVVRLTDSGTTTDRDLLESQERDRDGNDIGRDVTDDLDRRGVLGDEFLRHGEGTSLVVRESGESGRGRSVV